MIKTKWHFSQKTMTKTKSKFAVKMLVQMIIIYKMYKVTLLVICAMVFKCYDLKILGQW